MEVVGVEVAILGRVSRLQGCSQQIDDRSNITLTKYLLKFYLYQKMAPPAEGNVFADLSGTSNSTTGNPYDALLEACKNEPVTAPLSGPDRVVGKLIALETNPASLSDTPRDSK